VVQRQAARAAAETPAPQRKAVALQAVLVVAPPREFAIGTGA
jgi:hypothetical protein